MVRSSEETSQAARLHNQDIAGADSLVESNEAAGIVRVGADNRKNCEVSVRNRF